ncbi:MAG TPA: META domain-containing protein [Acidimicrobiia bacterium]|jgi:hypothetical protein|nr:META domain-containing protein [Acidimicrobiia bacterium]
MRADPTSGFRPKALGLILLIALLGACGTAGSTGSAGNSTPPLSDSTAEPSVTSTTLGTPTSMVEVSQSMLGEWELLDAESGDLDPQNERGLILVTFTVDRLFGIESCAPFDGTYQMEGDVLVFEEVETTAEGCSDWTDDANIFRFPSENPTVSIAGDRMLLIRSDWRLEFGRVP